MKQLLICLFLSLKETQKPGCLCCESSGLFVTIPETFGFLISHLCLLLCQPKQLLHSYHVSESCNESSKLPKNTVTYQIMIVTLTGVITGLAL